MKGLSVKILSKGGLGQVFFVLMVTALSLMILACSDSKSSGGGTNDPGGGITDGSNEPEPPAPEPKLGVVINSMETNECPNIKVYVSIADENNKPIEDDPALAAKLYEDGVEQTNNFSIQWEGDIQAPISVVFALDYSPSMSDAIEDMENGVKAFIDAMKPEDKAAIIKFSYEPQLFVGLTSDKTALYNAVHEPPDSSDNTNIYDTVFEAVNVVAGAEGRLAVILLTDGLHNPSPDYPVQNTLEQAVGNAKQNNVAVFSIALDLKDASEIKYISEETGGIYYSILDSSVISDVYLSLYELLDEQHLIVYTTDATDGLEHSVQISAEYGGVSGESIIQNFTSCTTP